MLLIEETELGGSRFYAPTARLELAHMPIDEPGVAKPSAVRMARDQVLAREE
jgi:hypothetical protein